MLLPLSYSVRNLQARPGRTLMTAGVIALVVIATSLFLEIGRASCRERVYVLV